MILAVATRVPVAILFWKHGWDQSCDGDQEAPLGPPLYMHATLQQQHHQTHRPGTS